MKTTIKIWVNKIRSKMKYMFMKNNMPRNKNTLDVKVVQLVTFNGIRIANKDTRSKNFLDHKWCKPKCRFSQVINHGKSEVDPQGMIRHERIILTILQKRKIKIKIGIFAFGFHSKVEQKNII
jgi:hypothetical protein